MSHIQANGSKIRELRIKKGWTLRELGIRTGINFSIISRLEAGESSPRPKTAKAIADALEVDFDEIFKIV
ncbi:helix-turn-helix protein [Caloramator mitchellensis]|uniref:Helix-turn-helix protein n=1 Tax=Caloramator mitchellensis TaxID=908809 RepID=A0A0R3JZ48_CALMK|nr:helix-turn-helix transcriptional regulator [Caloramator mitchellensis]KRQ85845.1 helix-turn-helix protein [Caloramator mitchellensis]